MAPNVAVLRIFLRISLGFSFRCYAPQGVAGLWASNQWSFLHFFHFVQVGNGHVLLGAAVGVNLNWYIPTTTPSLFLMIVWGWACDYMPTNMSSSPLGGFWKGFCS